MSQVSEEQRLLDRLDKLTEKLPYKTVKIEIVLESKTISLEKDNKQNRCGF